MRALIFNIQPETLTACDWSHWKRADADYILECATKNEIKAYDVGVDKMVFKGNPGNLFHFMYDVSYRYDVELI